MNDDLREQIEAYITNKLSPDELIQFEKEMVINLELREEVLLTKEINNHFQDTPTSIKIINTEFSNDLNTFFNSEEAVEIENKLLKVQKEYREKRRYPKKRRKIYLSFAAAIAVLIIGVIGYTILKQDTHVTLFNEYYAISDLPSITQRGSNNNIFYKGITAFKNKEYYNALTYFNDYKTTTKELDTINLLLYIEKYDKALIAFNEIAISNSIDRSKGLWFKTLVYLKLNDKVNTEKTLKEILKNPLNFKYAEARKLLKKYQ